MDSDALLERARDELENADYEVYDLLRHVAKDSEFDHKLRELLEETGGNRPMIDFAVEYLSDKVDIPPIVAVMSWVWYGDNTHINSELVVIELLSYLGSDGTLDAVRHHFDGDEDLLEAYSYLKDDFEGEKGG